MSARVVAHLVMASCWLSAAAGCSSPGPGNTDTQSTARGTAGRQSNGSNGGSTGGSSQTNGSGGNATGPGVTNGGSSGGRVGCQSECNLPGQFCDDAGLCVACLGNQQCMSPQPVCYLGSGPSYGTCVQCLKASDCPKGQACNLERLCAPGCLQGEPCSGDTPICEGDAGVCVSCLSATQCTGGLVCENGACMECTSDFECSLNYPNLWVCSPENNCVQCRVDADCPQGEHCVGTGCK